MITGFNTDIDYEGRIFHVQTEEKGQDNPIMESLVYSGGEIIASKKSSYSDLIESSRFTEAEVLERMEKQHQSLIREIYSGRFDPEGPKPFGYNLVSNRSLDEVVLDYLSTEIGVERIGIELEEAGILIEGNSHVINLRVMAEGSDRPIAEARATVKLLSSDGSPITLFSGATDQDGRVEASFDIPKLGTGEAAVLCQAEVGGNNAEVKILVQRRDNGI